MLENENRPLLTPPDGERKLVLHSCCAPCSGSIMDAMVASGIDFTIFFYNPNIHPRREYEIRKSENIRYARKIGIPFVDADYNPDHWFRRMKGMEREPERGARCSVCFDMRFERTALFAHENGFKIFTSSLGISRCKDTVQVNQSGTRAAARYPNLTFWNHNWRKEGGCHRMCELVKKENFYQQKYCGCIYSLRDTNLWRQQNGRERIQIGSEYDATHCYSVPGKGSFDLTP